jgi:hypothetical protein
MAAADALIRHYCPRPQFGPLSRSQLWPGTPPSQIVARDLPLRPQDIKSQVEYYSLAGRLGVNVLELRVEIIPSRIPPWKCSVERYGVKFGIRLMSCGGEALNEMQV